MTIRLQGIGFTTRASTQFRDLGLSAGFRLGVWGPRSVLNRFKDSRFESDSKVDEYYKV